MSKARNPLLKYIYPHQKGWNITKRINGKNKYYKTFHNLDDAIKYRDQLIKNNWEEIPPTPEEESQKNQKKYYHRICLNSSKQNYQIFTKKHSYIGTVENIEEALYYRDLYSDCPTKVPSPSEVDLVTDNPYYITGLAYPLPERLVKAPKKDSKYGKGIIQQKSVSSYVVKKNKNSYCSCRTYEQAYYVRKELQKCNWDKTQIPRILKEYPIWYTKLMHFYRYVMKNPQPFITNKWIVNIPREHWGNDGSVDRYYYRNVEDALFERDFLMQHNWDYELLVETIDDNDNPYYDMEIPPYPERKIRNLSEIDTHEDKLNKMRDLILEGILFQGECAEAMDTSSINIRNWLGKYNMLWKDFVELVLSGEDIWSVLEKPEHIYQPDLSPTLPNYKGYIHKNQSNRSPYMVVRRGEYFGAYPDKKTAKKITTELKKCNWDKSKLKEIQDKIGHERFINSKNWVYANNKGKSYVIRKKDKDMRMVNYGSYRCKKYAEEVRDWLIKFDWNRDKLEYIQDLAQKEMIKKVRLFYGTNKEDEEL